MQQMSPLNAARGWIYEYDEVAINGAHKKAADPPPAA